MRPAEKSEPPAAAAENELALDQLLLPLLPSALLLSTRESVLSPFLSFPSFAPVPCVPKAAASPRRPDTGAG